MYCVLHLSRGIVHTNTAEGYFSQLKRSIDGTHHHVSERHLDRYLAEFDYRYTMRKMKDGERTEHGSLPGVWVAGPPPQERRRSCWPLKSAFAAL